MATVFLKYNKPTNESFWKLYQEFCVWYRNQDYVQQLDLDDFKEKKDFLDYTTISRYLKFFLNSDPEIVDKKKLFVGDIFWTTGQNICAWSDQNKIQSFFLQHGQWIYVENKKNPAYVPNVIFVFGDNVLSETQDWPLAHRSKMVVTGSPRYDDSLKDISNKGYVYFAPPVVNEISHSGRTKYNKTALEWLGHLKGIDAICQLHIHPHYREGNVDQIKSVFPSATFIPQTDSPLTWVKECDRVLTHRNSTTILDAIAHKKRVILMNFEHYNEYSYYPNGYFKDFAIESNEPNACIRLAGIKFTNIEENDADYIVRSKPYIYLGNASERIVEYCRGI